MDRDTKEICKKCDLAEDKLTAFTRSKVRTQVILSLLEGETSAKKIADSMGVIVTTILHAIKDLIKDDLVIKTSEGYELTNVGTIQAQILEDLVNTIVALDQHHDFWMSHNLSGIPIELQKKIGLLAESQIREAVPGAILKTVEDFIKELSHSKEIRGVSPIIITGYSDAIASAIKNGSLVELIVTNEIFNIMAASYGDMLKGLIKCDNFKLYKINEDTKVAFTVTESMLNLGLFRLDGGYDLGADLICTGDGATLWGKELFENYRRRSELVRDF